MDMTSHWEQEIATIGLILIAIVMLGTDNIEHIDMVISGLVGLIAGQKFKENNS